MSFNTAVVGTGFIGPVHVEALRRLGIHVQGILGSRPEKSRAAAQRLGLDHAYHSFDELLGDASIDAVHITTPNRFHFEQARGAIEAGKHVMCEKPLAMNSGESAELVRLAADRGRAAAVAYNIRSYPLCHEAAARVGSGDIGELLHVTGSYVQDWLLFDRDFNWRVLASDGGALRAVADIGTHWLDLIQFITGKRIVSVCADLHTIHSKRQQPLGDNETFAGKAGAASERQEVDVTTEDCGSVMLRFDNDANGCLWISQTTAGRKNCLRFEIAGSQRALAWDSEQPNSLWIGKRDAANEVLIRDPQLLHDAPADLAAYPGGHNEGFPDTFKQLFRQFYQSIAAGDLPSPAPYPTFLDGHREIILCEAILQSHQSRAWVDIKDNLA